MILTSAPILFAVFLGCWQDAASFEDAEAPDPLAVACQEFERSSPAARAQVIADVDAAIAACDDPGVRQLQALVDRARRELKVLPATPAVAHAAEVFAPAQPRRLIRDRDHPIAAEMIGRFERHGSEPVFTRRVRYDFGWNVAVDSGVEPTPIDRLYNTLYGYPPGVDVLVAWLESYFDFDDSLDPVALHFAQLYSDLQGNCARGVELYDAFASFAGVDMPDVDVIAFARNVLHDDTFYSPIPPGSRQTQLFERIHLDFLKYFRHRTLVEYTANLYLNPEAPLDYAHEALRDRILYGFHLDQMDLQRIRARLIRDESRGRFIDDVDLATRDDPYWRWNARQVGARRNETRWVIARLAHAVLREHGFLRDKAAEETDPTAGQVASPVAEDPQGRAPSAAADGGP